MHCCFPSDDGSWSPNLSVIRYGHRHRRGMMSLHRCYGMTIHRCREMTIHRRFRANMSLHRCCAIPIPSPILSMSRENHCVAQADSAEAHCAGPADCNEVDSVARATNSLAVLWESR